MKAVKTKEYPSLVETGKSLEDVKERLKKAQQKMDELERRLERL